MDFLLGLLMWGWGYFRGLLIALSGVKAVNYGLDLFDPLLFVLLF